MIKRLAGCIRQYKRDTILTPLFMVGEVTCECIIPLLTADLINNIQSGCSMDVILGYGLKLFLVAMLSLACGAASGWFCASSSAGFARNLRKDLYYKVQDFSFSNIDKFSASSLVTRMTTDVSNVQNAYQMLIRMAFRSPMLMIFSAVFAFRIYPRLAVIFVACLPVLMAGLYFIMTKTHPIFKRVFKTYDLLNQKVQENLRGIRVVKSFIREDHETDKFEGTSESIRSDFTHAEKNLAWNAPLMQGCSYTCMIIVSWLGAKAIVACGGDPTVAGGLSTGGLMSLITYAMQILMSVMMLTMVFVMTTIAREGAERICEVLDEKSDLTNGENPVETVPDGSISFDHVNFYYSKTADKLCLDDVTVDIKSGETVGIIGGTGSSKSTFVQMIPRLYDVTGGSVKVGGRDVREYDLEALRDAVAVVLQKNVLFSGTVKENLRWGNENATDEELIEACKLAQADDFVQKMPNGYDTYIEQGGSNVSGGQKQRLCIARALLKKPKVLILDDSTSAVDTKTDALIREAFKEYIPDTTKIIIAQRIASVQDADKIIVLDGGKIAAMGTHDELLKTSDIYREVYESQKGGMSGD